MKGRTGYFSGSKGEREVFSGEGFPSEGARGDRDFFFREIEREGGISLGRIEKEVFKQTWREEERRGEKEIFVAFREKY